MITKVPPALPTKTELGFRAETVGSGLSIVKGSALEVPPPGAGVEIATVTVPALAMSEAVMAACRLELETKVVGRALPFH